MLICERCRKQDAVVHFPRTAADGSTTVHHYCLSCAVAIGGATTAAPASQPQPCVFCDIVAGRAAANIVASDTHVIAVLDQRQFHPGHVLVIPLKHVPDIRALKGPTADAMMRMIALVSRAVDKCFPSDGISVWHSAGPGANQEVPHLHFHVHPRRLGDELLRVYPRAPAQPDQETLKAWAGRLGAVIAARDASA
jgi:histidine triad (HIT) family protein